MSIFAKFFIISIILLLFVTISLAQEKSKQVNWEVFSKNLVIALGTPNEGLQLSAMSRIICYGDSLDVTDAVFDVMEIFRNHKDNRIRILAMVTLSKMGSEWAMDTLKRNIKFEKDERVKKYCCFIVQSYYADMNTKTQNEGGLYSIVEN